jgi:hypothetical protein
MGEECSCDREQHRHGADHERGVRDRGAVEAGELDEELKRDAEEGAEQESAPLAAIEVGSVGEEQRNEDERGEEEAVEHHGAHAHLSQRDLAEEEAAAPEGAGESAGGKAENAVLVGPRRLHPVWRLRSKATIGISEAATDRAPSGESPPEGECEVLSPGHYQTRQLLVGTMGVGFLQPKAGGEAGLVDDDAVDAESVGGVGVLQDLGADGSGRTFWHQVLGEADVEALRAGEAVDLGAGSMWSSLARCM